jgi:hypothetical protein
MQSTARRAALLFTGLVCAGAGLVAGAPQAAAGTDESIVTERGSVSWFHDGDKVLACDANEDGLSIEANYRLAGDTGTGRVLHAAGAGKCESATWDKNEGDTVEIRMCYRDDFVITECSDWQRAEA